MERNYPDHYYLSRATLYLEDRDGNEDVSQRPHNAEQTGIVLGLIRQAQQVAASESKGLVAGFLTREDITLFTAAGMHYSTELTRCIIWPELNEGTSLPEHTVLTAYGMDIRAHRFGHEPTSNEVWGLLPSPNSRRSPA